MQVFHPSQAPNGLSPENYFLVADAAGQVAGEGYLIPTYHPYLFPDRPVNIFMNLRTSGHGQDMLMGALLARAQQIREQYPQHPARLFTQLSPQNTTLQAFYAENGFDESDGLDVVRLNMPDARAAAPMGYDMGFVPLTNTAEFSGFLSRMNSYRLNAWNAQLLKKYMSYPHFFALYLSRGGVIAGEAAFTGEGRAAKLIGLYVDPRFRQKGLAKCLIATGIKDLTAKGVVAVDADCIRRNELQCALAASCQATFVRTACLYPGLNYD